MLIAPLDRPPDTTVAIPGSKSITNRALVCALLADGRSVLDGALFADDTEAMIGVAEALGAGIEVDRRPGDNISRIVVQGSAGRLAAGPLTLDARLSGTTSRFAAPLAARGVGPYTLDGAPPMRARPMGATVEALRALGVNVEGDALPLVIGGGLEGGEAQLPASASSQFASGLMLAAPGTAKGLTIEFVGEVVSRPYLEMTASVMRSFGAEVDATKLGFTIGAQPYVANDYRVEPDASAASYFFAAAALTGGRVRVEGLAPDALQGDVAFVDVLARMGADVTKTSSAIEVQGTGRLSGVEVDMTHISDTAQTLAAIAPFADSPTRVTGIDFIRRKETDRIAAVVTELKRLGIDAAEEADGFVIHPGTPQPGTVQTYHDHRMAMSFAVTGLAAAGIEIADPGCVDKTFPEFWETLETLR